MTNEQHPDRGFSLIEVLLVVLVLGLLGAIVVSSSGDTIAESRADSRAAECAADAQRLTDAVEAYFTGRAMRVIEAVDATPDGFERRLVVDELLADVSTHHDLDVRGTVRPAPGSPCSARG